MGRPKKAEQTAAKAPVKKEKVQDGPVYSEYEKAAFAAGEKESAEYLEKKAEIDAAEEAHAKELAKARAAEAKAAA